MTVREAGNSKTLFQDIFSKRLKVIVSIYHVDMNICYLRVLLCISLKGKQHSNSVNTTTVIIEASKLTDIHDPLRISV